MFCTISNEVCQHPVISKKTGHIYELSLLEKHLNVTGKCPVTEDNMTMDDIIEVQGYQQPSQPKPPSSSSIPVLLKTLQNEWDQMMLESYQLKKHAQELRQQLSHSLYQHDAACRVIARLTQERDRAVEQLANTRQTMTLAMADAQSLSKSNANQISQQNNGTTSEVEDIDMDGTNNTNNSNNNNNNSNQNNNGPQQKSSEKKEIETPDNSNQSGSYNTAESIVNYYPKNLWNANEMSKDVIDAISNNATVLSESRKKRRKQKNESLATADNLSNYSLTSQYTSHSEQDAGITCMDLHSNPAMNKYIVTGGIDCNVIVSNRESKSLDHVLRGHTKKISGVSFHSSLPLIISSSFDSTCRVWRYDSNDLSWKNMSLLDKTHSGPITDISLHNLDCYYATSSYDGSWSLNSLEGRTILRKYDINDNDSNADNNMNGHNNNNNNSGFTTIAVHPDGNLIGTGCELNNLVKIWDIRDGKIGATFDGHRGHINKIIFNENGYYLGSCDDNGIVKIWDLRKIGKKEGCYTFNEFKNNKIKYINFDNSGSYLSIGLNNGIEIYQCKKWKKITGYYKHNSNVTGIKFGPDAKFIVSAGKDRNINVYS